MKPLRINFVRVVAPLLLVFVSGTQPFLQATLEMVYEDEAAVDLRGGRTIELHEVVVLEQQGRPYADLNGSSALTVVYDPTLDFAPGDSLWIELWVEPLQVVGTTPLVLKGANYRLGLTRSREPYFAWYSDGSWQNVTAEQPLDIHAWHHVALWFDSGAGEAWIFVDGILAARADSLPPFQSRDEGPLHIGGQPRSEEQGGGYSGLSGGIGPLILSRERQREFDFELEIGDQAFEPEPF